MNKKTYRVFVTQKVSAYVDVIAEDIPTAHKYVDNMLEMGFVRFDDQTAEHGTEIDGIVCEECDNVFEEGQGAFKKDSEDTWLCDDCTASLNN